MTSVRTAEPARGRVRSPTRERHVGGRLATAAASPFDESRLGQIRIAFRSELWLHRVVVARPANPMPTDVEQRLIDEELMDDYRDRPRCQRNDYLGWIGRAKRPATREKRIRQMLDELRTGGVYMNMEHAPSKKP